MEKDRAQSQIEELVEQYTDRRGEYRSEDYLESEVRSDFIDPFFKALGWDVDNEKNRPLSLREVKQEASLKSEEGGTKKPDYEFRDDYGESLFYVEAKKPNRSVDSLSPALQTRQYGWTAGMSFSILTNFERLVVYDCTVPPEEDDRPHTARLRVYNYTDYVEKFDEIYSLFSRSNVLEGSLEEEFGTPAEAAERKTFDEVFLEQLEDWRETLAENIIKNNPDIDQDELNYFVHRLLNRIIFLRIAEDRDLETHERLKSLEDVSYESLVDIFEEADEKYNSDLFDLIDEYSDENLDIDSETLATVLEELYYPHSPYTFAVVESDIIGRIYDLFLGKGLFIEDGELSVEEKPEVLHSQGAVTTPSSIVDSIVNESVTSQIEGKSPSELEEYSIGDICCGSGVFLTSAFESLVDHYRNWYTDHNKSEYLVEVGGNKRLKFEKRREILEEHVFGVDIDKLAVEVTRFNLMLKLLEDQPKALIEQYETSDGFPLLPSLTGNIQNGNSLVDEDYYTEYDEGVGESVYAVNP
ncbi:MAG: N-6 DNA methylase, partial [Halobacteriaceae archaeon]